MGGFTAKITGLHELDEKLAELGDKAAKRIVNAGLRAAGEVFSEAVRSRTPVRAGGTSGSALPPGALKNDIGYHVGGTEGEGGRALPAVFVRPGKYTQRVANWLEYGHRQVHGGYLKLNRVTGQRRGPGREMGAVPAHPFIRPAYEAARERAAQACCDAIAKGVEKAAKT